MLKSIFISNYALISVLDISLEPGLSVITGETGAGKSIILGALSLIMGQRADNKAIKPDEDKCVVEALFDISAYKHLDRIFEENELDNDGVNCLIRRELSSNGKSRAFVNDTPVSLNVLRDLSSRLIDIHSQHENLLLSNTSYQLEVLDIVAGNAGELADYRKSFGHWSEKKKALAELRDEAARAGSEVDFIRFQYNQLTEARLSENEQEDLEHELDALNHAEEVKTEIDRTMRLLSGDEAVLALLKEAVTSLSKIARFIPDGESVAQRLESDYIDLKDIAEELSGRQEQFEFNPARQEWVGNRLSEIYSLEKKYKVNTVGELIAKREEYALRLHDVESYDEEIAALQHEVEEAFNAMKQRADVLTESRRKHIPVVEKYLMEQLSNLGMPNIRFEVSLTISDDFSDHGTDEVRFFFSANKNRPVQPVDQTASGGEISRLMLAIKSLIAGRSDLPTIIFDEIDTGVSGEIAHKMGEIMLQMSVSMQVITITHLPQIASRGSHHFKVYKDESGSNTETYIRKLTQEERIGEIASMLSGKDRGEAAMRNARELLGL